MLACSMGHSAFAQTLGRKKTVTKGNAILVVQGTIVSECVEGLDISTSSTLMHTKPQLMIRAVEIHYKTNITKNGIAIWPIVTPELN